jgi:hypothetical protein
MTSIEFDKCKYIHPYGLHVNEQCSKRNNYGDYCISHKDYTNGRCTAIIEQGANKGKQCTRPCIKEKSVCGKHETFAKLLEYTSDSKYKCFTHRCTESITSPKSYCLKCKEIKSTTKKCKAIIASGGRKGKQCQNKADDDYCDKHSQHYILLEIAKTRNMNICGKGVRCSELIPKYKVYCDKCSELRRKHEKERYDIRIADMTRCCDCGKKDIEFATTLLGKISRYCIDCYSKMRIIEDRRDRTIANESIHNPDLYYRRYKSDAERRGKTFELSFSDFMNIIAKPCNYCGKQEELMYNGVDRQDNTIGYTIDNCVSACSMCNLMKSSYVLKNFIGHIVSISEYQTTGVSIPSDLEWVGTNDTSFEEYKHISIKKRNLEFAINEEYYSTLKSQPCYLCGYKPKYGCFNGIDRIDSDIGYIDYNCAPCCVYCNRMKNTHSLEEFIDKCHKIRSYSSL